MALDRPRQRAGEAMAGEAVADELDVAVVRFPTISNFTDLDPLTIELGVRVRFVHDRAGLGDPDLIVLPGTKATVADLGWLRSRGLAAAITAGSAPVLAICGGYQMLGRTIDDGVESGAGQVDGLDVLPVDTCFEARKVTLLRAGSVGGNRVRGYQIHHGRVRVRGGDPFVVLDDEHGAGVDGVQVGRWFGTTLHGLLEDDGFRRYFLARVARERGKVFVSAGPSFAAAREQALDAVADAMAEHLDLAAIDALIAEAVAPAGANAGARP